jgi:hypothetical protein
LRGKGCASHEYVREKTGILTRPIHEGKPLNRASAQLERVRGIHAE